VTARQYQQFIHSIAALCILVVRDSQCFCLHITVVSWMVGLMNLCPGPYMFPQNNPCEVATLLIPISLSALSLVRRRVGVPFNLVYGKGIRVVLSQVTFCFRSANQMATAERKTIGTRLIEINLIKLTRIGPSYVRSGMHVIVLGCI